MKPFLMFVLVVQLTACGLFSSKPEPKPPSLADLQPISIPDKSNHVEAIDLSALTDLYKDALSYTDDPVVRKNIKQRLASIEVKHSENRLVEGDQTPALFASAATAYEALLEEFPDSENNDRALYQLGKAYELNGDIEKAVEVFKRLTKNYPRSDHYIESQFRLAEYYFSANQYGQSSLRYKEVILGGQETPYYQKSLYMRAWALFKLDRFQPSIDSFMLTIDLLIPNENALQELERGEQELLKDCFRVVSIIFAGLDGSQSLVASNESRGRRHYDHLLYANLATHYLGQERFKDSADTYKRFIGRYPTSTYSHHFHAKVVNVYQRGGFAEDVLVEKANYIAAYKVNGEYWLLSTLPVRLLIGEQLKTYLIEMASYHHSFAQRLQGEQAKLLAKKTAKEFKASTQLGVDSNKQYLKAVFYYGLFVESFPGDKRLAEQLFLLAEVQYELADFQQAINSYERVAYQLETHTPAHLTRASEAGYAAILTYDELYKAKKLALSRSELEPQQVNEELFKINLEKVNSSLLFSNRFPADKRTADVLANAAKDLLQIKDYPRAIAAAERLTQWQPAAEKSIVITAWLIIAQASFETSDYLYAEASYQQILKRIPVKDTRRKSLTERLAASIYKQGEQAVKLGDNTTAAEHYMRIIEVAPASSIRLNAQYDAATLYLSSNEFTKAVDLLVDFRKRFPANELSVNISAKLAFAYQELEHWLPAANELMTEYEREQDPVKKAQLLYLAAGMFEKAGDHNQAINQYRTYAHGYKSPFDLNVEAMFKLNELYVKTNDESKRRFWLNRIIKVDKAAGKQRTDRSRYLAAWASSIFANDAFQAFKAVKLDLPLKKSFKRKKKAMKLVVTRYKATNSYGIAEFSTLSSYRLAEVYGQLSRDLIDSKRPSNLDELAMEQYEILLEEQAYPFEEKAIQIHEQNAQRSWGGVYDKWVKNSFKALTVLLPARYLKEEDDLSFSEGIY